MRGSMRRRGDAWQLRVYLGRDPVTGRKRYRTRTVRGGRREAERMLASMVGGSEVGAETGVLTGVFRERWFDHAAPDWSPRTVVQHRGLLDRYLIPRFGLVSLSRLEPAEIDGFYAGLRRSPGPGLAPASVRRIHGVLHAALAQGVKWG